MSFLKHRLQKIKNANLFRQLPQINLEQGIDFCSNDYISIVKNNLIEYSNMIFKSGATGSRLISGNSYFKEKVETQIALFHKVEKALIFNSGYDANLGLFSCLGKKGDTFIYDELIHASMRDGIRLSFAYAHFFKHNNLTDLENKLSKAEGNIFIAIESVYSMNGDIAPIQQIIDLCQKYDANLIVDEAHALGVIGSQGGGVIQHLNLEQYVFARIYTYGKALGIHGAAVVGSQELIDYLINSARSFIYSTAMPDENFYKISQAYSVLPNLEEQRKKLPHLISIFKNQKFKFETIDSNSVIQGIKIDNLKTLMQLSQHLIKQKIFVLPIRYPTVPEGEERLRISLHSFNTEDEIFKLAEAVNIF